MATQHRRQRVGSIGSLKATTSSLATAFTTLNPSLTLQGDIHILSDISNHGYAGLAAFEVFHFYLITGKINTARFVPKQHPYIPTHRSASRRYSFEVQAISILAAKRLKATRLIELLLLEMDREFLHKELIKRDFLLVEQVNYVALDDFIFKWATTKKGNAAEPSAEVLIGLQEKLSGCTYVQNLLRARILEHRTFRRQNLQVAEIIQSASNMAHPTAPNGNANATAAAGGGGLPGATLTVRIPKWSRRRSYSACISGRTPCQSSQPRSHDQLARPWAHGVLHETSTSNSPTRSAAKKAGGSRGISHRRGRRECPWSWKAREESSEEVGVHLSRGGGEEEGERLGRKGWQRWGIEDEVA